MKRLINFRVSLFCAIGLLVGIFCGYQLMFGEYVFAIVFAAVMAIATTLLAIFKNKLCIAALFVFIFAFVGFGVFELKLLTQQREEIVAQEVVLTGRVSDIDRNGNVKNVLYLESCTYGDNKIQGRVYVPVFDGTCFDAGNVVTFHGTLRSVYVFADNANVDCLRHNVKFELTNTTLISQYEGKLKLDEIVRKYVFDVSTKYTFNYGGVMYALITGDDSAMGESVKHSYQSAGLVHLLAVSGMHIVYIITIFGFFLRRFKLHPLVEFALMILPLVFFSYVCRWVPSMSRALLMTVCVYVARWVFGRYDLLTSLSWSTLILLTIQPYYLFDVGWQLSALSVLGIATLHMRVDRYLKSKKIPKLLYGLLSSMSISLSCTLATFATMAHYFQQVPILGVFANVIAVPLMSVTFTCGVIGLLPWVFHYSMYCADAITFVVTKLAQGVASLNFAVVALSATALAIVITVVWLLVSGQFVNLSKVGNVVAHCLCALAFVACFVATAIKLPCKDQTYISHGYDNVDVVVTNKSGQVAVISNLQNGYSVDNLSKYLQKYDYDSCALYVTDFSLISIVDAQRFLQLVAVDKVYLLDRQGNDVALALFDARKIPVISLPSGHVVGDQIQIEPIWDGSLSAVVVTNGQMRFATLCGGAEQTNHFTNLMPNLDFYVVNATSGHFNDKNLVTFSYYQDYCATNYGANKYGNFTITQKDGTMLVSFK